jgi:hypothetical protein
MPAKEKLVRLQVSMAAANEQLIALINGGYQVLANLRADYQRKKAAGVYNEAADNALHRQHIDTWANEVVTALAEIFPTELERNLFLNPEIPFGAVADPDYQWKVLTIRFKYFIVGLENIRRTALPQYTDLPTQDRLYVEDIDSFSKVRDVNPHMVTQFLKNGYLDWLEDSVQLALEQILGVSFHKPDWGGEINDLCTANVIVNGRPRPTAFVLKGRGTGPKEMTIADCGKNGDQLVRLFDSPADLFVVQYVGPIADMLVRDVQGKIDLLKAKRQDVRFLIIDGQDTARLLHAYGKL